MTAPVLFSTRTAANGRQIGVATLNSEKSLNALSLEMVDALHAQLLSWQADDNVVCVWLQGAGEKAFCAGGDIRAMHQAAADHPGEQTPEVEAFFTREYRLDYLIHRYGKPIVVWGSGIVMGGGLGLMAGASHRLVTETSRIAMPEITIGLYPDVGGTWFLNRMPGHCGRFLGLTGYSMNGADVRYVGLADHLVASERRDSLQEALLTLGWQADARANHDLLSGYLRGIEEQDLPTMPHSTLHEAQAQIDELMAGSSLELIAERVAALETDQKWLARAQKSFLAGSPITAHLVWHQLTCCGELSLETVFQRELIWSVRCAELGDFVEGVRALLIDKDGQPRWRYPDIASVPASLMAQMLTSPWQEHPLADLKENVV
ncbi:enoyl-CoA hydratase/isomerase family protein [Ferrimonas balearica]|uniref:enoyl-CoA hydratase/isomerase family protein n=1 Tax=Ferrimonas balearica TaxID=44012 RepID=UPI001C57F985|nr:enoyl-CoA hydratase/isomerase family protein [Ferrimonas balearica]MBW3138137.1 enoyl-CoA hydratase/isomerase family protein [Ferrimonas balearica]